MTVCQTHSQLSVEKDWYSLDEMKDRALDILDFIATVAAPRLKKNVDCQVPPVCMVYAMMMNQRWQELSLVQKIDTIRFLNNRVVGLCPPLP